MSTRVSATLGYRDAAHAIEFLVTAFGFDYPLRELVQDASGHWKPAHQ